jgi:predicted RNase H-like nuclease (RuvC/YqgF family)
MQRVYGHVSDEIVHLMDADAAKEGITRSKWISNAISAFLHRSDAKGDAQSDALSASEVKSDALTGEEGASHSISEVHLRQQIADLKDALAEKDEKIAKKDDELKKTQTELELKWRDFKEARSEASALKREVEASRDKIGRMQADLDKERFDAELARDEVVVLKRDQEHYKDTVANRDKQIGFLEGHVAQLTQSISQLSLKPGEEEIKAKHWYQFWK